MALRELREIGTDFLTGHSARQVFQNVINGDAGTNEYRLVPTNNISGLDDQLQLNAQALLAASADGSPLRMSGAAPPSRPTQVHGLSQVLINSCHHCTRPAHPCTRVASRERGLREGGRVVEEAADGAHELGCGGPVEHPMVPGEAEGEPLHSADGAVIGPGDIVS